MKADKPKKPTGDGCQSMCFSSFTLHTDRSRTQKSTDPESLHVDPAPGDQTCGVWWAHVGWRRSGTRHLTPRRKLLPPDDVKRWICVFDLTVRWEDSVWRRLGSADPLVRSTTSSFRFTLECKQRWKVGAAWSRGPVVVSEANFTQKLLCLRARSEVRGPGMSHVTAEDVWTRPPAPAPQTSHHTLKSVGNLNEN